MISTKSWKVQFEISMMDMESRFVKKLKKNTIFVNTLNA